MDFKKEDDLRAMEESEGSLQRALDVVLARRRRWKIIMTLLILSICGILIVASQMVAVSGIL